MRWIPGRRRTIGGTLFAGGAATLAATLLLTSPATRVQAAPTGVVFLAITMSDGAAGHFPTGSRMTVTASVTNSLGTANTTSVGDASPTVTLNYNEAAMSVLSGGASWSCSSVTTGTEVCTDGTITQGGSTTLPVVFTVTGNPGDPASVTGSVTDGGAVNIGAGSGSGTGVDSATDSASVDNAASYTKDVSSGGFTGKLGVDQVLQNSTQTNTFTFTDSSVTVTLVIPQGSLPSGTHVSIYKAAPGFWNSALSSSSASFVDGYAAAWTASGASTGVNARGVVTLVVSDPGASSSHTLYRATTTGVGSSTTTAHSGAWTATFTEDPGFVLAAVIPATATTSSPTTSSGSSVAGTGTLVTPPSAGGGRGSGGGAALPLAAAILLLVGGVAVLGTGRRRTTG